MVFLYLQLLFTLIYSSHCTAYTEIQNVIYVSHSCSPSTITITIYIKGASVHNYKNKLQTFKLSIIF